MEVVRPCLRSLENSTDARMTSTVNSGRYAGALTAHLWAYQETVFADEEHLFDQKYSHLPNPPVFTRESADRNVIVPDGPAQAAALLKLLPPGKQHRWFRSMKSSQALALSVFGNLKILNRADCLATVQDEDGFGPAFRNGVIGPDDLQLEYDVTSLNEIRATSVDLFVSGLAITCVECKLSEVEVGCCSRPALKKEHDAHSTHRDQSVHAIVITRTTAS